MTSVVALSLIALITYLCRTCFVTLVPAARLPARVQGCLDDVAPAVMAALVASHLIHGHAGGTVRPTDVVALAVAATVAWRTTHLGITCAVGVVTAALLRVV